MGSQLRKLRAKAGVTGRAHQKRLRESARRKERARLSFQDGNVIVGVNSKGGQLRSAGELQAKLESSKAKSEMDRLLADMAQHARESNEARQAGHIEREIAEQIAAAGAGWPDSGPFHVADYLSPLDARVHGLGEVCRVCGKAKPAPVLAVDVSPETQAQLTEILATGGLPRVDPAPPSDFVKTTVSGVYEAEAIELKVGGEVVPQVPEPPKQEWHIHRPGQRSRLFSLLALAMVGGLAVPPRRDR